MSTLRGEAPVRSRAMGAMRPIGPASTAGALAAVVGAALVCICRVYFPGAATYVSGMGAPGVPLAPLFNFALLCVAASGLLIAADLRSARATPPRRVLGGVLSLGAACFAVASTVPCSPGCPLPFSAEAAPQDYVHISAAVAGFAACLICQVLVVATRGSALFRAFTATSLTIVGVASVSGAAMAIFGATDIGAWCEFAATLCALAWLVVLAMARGAWDRTQSPADAVPADAVPADAAPAAYPAS